MVPITVKDVELIAFELARKHLEWGEPIPDISTRFPGVLESCLSAAFQTHGRKDLYPGLLDKSAIIFYSMIKNHPFLNGNKRIAVTTLLVFLAKNKKWLKVSNEQLYQFALWVAESQPQLRRGVLLSIKEFIRLNLVDF